MGAKGTALWPGTAASPRTLSETISTSLGVFVSALRTGLAPPTSVHGNVLSLAMVLCAVASAESGAPVTIDDTLAEAHAVALREAAPDVASVLRSWPSVRAALTR